MRLLLEVVFVALMLYAAYCVFRAFVNNGR
jgi:hypothetical protein